MHSSIRKTHCPNEQLTAVTFSNPDVSTRISIPPTYPTVGENFPSCIPQPVLYVGSVGRRHTPHKSVCFKPFGTPAQSKQVELSPLQTPHASLPASRRIV